MTQEDRTKTSPRTHGDARGDNDGEGSLIDVVIVGGGPVGLACGIAAKRAGLSAVILEKGCITNSVFNFPTNMTFFTTPELMEIGDHPLITGPHGKATRTEALDYYRSVTRVEKLPLRLYEEVLHIVGEKGDFRTLTRSRHGDRKYRSRYIVLATGYYDTPNRLGISGEELAHVDHYYTEAHSFAGRKVLVVGGKNSACETALDLFRHDALVTIAHRGAAFGDSVKYWVRPDIENRLAAGEIRGLFETTIREIHADGNVVFETAGETIEENFEQVFLLTGYHPDPDFLSRCGLVPDPDDLSVRIDTQTLESHDVPGLYLAGSASAGHHTGMIFIENGRHDSHTIFEKLAK